MTGENEMSEMIGWILQVKEIIALVSVLAFCWFIMTKHIPFLLMREAERSEREAARHQSNHAAMEKCIDKLDDTMRNGLDHLKDAIVEIARHNSQLSHQFNPQFSQHTGAKKTEKRESNEN
jgi:hypothetical protein